MLAKWFRDSETLLWARLQALVGIIAAIVTFVDPQVIAPVLPPAWVPWLVVANGAFSEYLRRRRDPEMKRGQ